MGNSIAPERASPYRSFRRNDPLRNKNEKSPGSHAMRRLYAGGNSGIFAIDREAMLSYHGDRLSLMARRSRDFMARPMLASHVGGVHLREGGRPREAERLRRADQYRP